MVTAIEIDDGLKVGDGWRYHCWKCNRQIKIDRLFPKGFPPKKCPGCGTGGWWGHLVTPAINQNMDGVKRVEIDRKNSEVTMLGGIRTCKRILTQPENAVEHGKTENNGAYEPRPGRERGRPRLTVPGDLILELSERGFSCRAMARELNKRGYKTGYKTVHRRLQASLL